MISTFRDLEKLFEEIDASLKESVTLYVIGGANLLYHNLKIATKDIDFVVETTNEFDAFTSSIMCIGFRTKRKSIPYSRLNMVHLLVREPYQIDIFCKTVCEKLQLSDAMKTRAFTVASYNWLTIKLCSLEDVFIFKSITERAGDIEDSMQLARRGLAWDIVLAEMQNQITISGQSVWITWFGQRLEELSDRGISIPIINEVSDLVAVYYEEYSRNFINAKRDKK